MSSPDQCEQARRKALRKPHDKRYERTAAGRARRRRAKLLARYGLTIEQYDKMLVMQNGACVRCGRTPKTMRLAVEHDHHTKRVRGLACFQCNKYLIGKNTAETAKWLVAYLTSDFDGRKL